MFDGTPKCKWKIQFVRLFENAGKRVFELQAKRQFWRKERPNANKTRA